MRNVNEVLGISGGRLGDLFELAIIALGICTVVLALGATVVLGTYVHYQHIDHMADNGFVLRSRKIGEGLGSSIVEEWVREDKKTE